MIEAIRSSSTWMDCQAFCSHLFVALAGPLSSPRRSDNFVKFNLMKKGHTLLEQMGENS